jgi:hypothetical protein
MLGAASSGKKDVGNAIGLHRLGKKREPVIMIPS